MPPSTEAIHQIFHTMIVPTIHRIIGDKRIQIQPTFLSYRIPTDEPSYLRIIVTPTVIHQSCLIISILCRKSKRIKRGIGSRFTNRAAEGIVFVGRLQFSVERPEHAVDVAQIVIGRQVSISAFLSHQEASDSTSSAQALSHIQAPERIPGIGTNKSRFGTTGVSASLTSKPPWAPLFNPIRNQLVSPSVQGWHGNPLQAIDWTAISLQAE
jgi:hypothetical protein